MTDKQIHTELVKLIPREQIFTDHLSRLTKGTDAGLYRLIPKVVVQVNSEDEVIRLLNFCNKNKIGVTFKAAGTSLSGQTISDSVLIEIGKGFEYSTITDNGHTVTFGTGLTGRAANAVLRRYGRKLGPKPASINSAKIGGIISNNASGSSYGIAHNSYNTIKSMRIIFPDGTLLDTGNSESRKEFALSHPQLISEILTLHHDATENIPVKERIEKKFQLKNTCGYGVNSLIDFSDPIDIIQHLMVGSEGTLGFISQATFKTVHDAPLKASAMIYFANLRDVSKTIIPLRGCKVSAAELMDRNALRAVEDMKGMPRELKSLPEGAAALLVDTSADDNETLLAQMAEIEEKLGHIETLYPIEFTTDKFLYNLYWNVRNGLFTSAAATRPPHTATIIEDVAFRGEVLGEALTDLRDLLIRTGYEDAVMWGHLLDGNVHFTVFPDINNEEGIQKYARFMHELSDLVAVKHEGSMKAEHGTGRNMAPFVEKEWGEDIYGLMKRIKHVFDPTGILNPGVVINDDSDVFIKNLKSIPQANPIIDKCIECGFCEVVCPSKDLTVTPRQRIVAYRYIADSIRGDKQNSTRGDKQRRKAIMKEVKKISYSLDETCATDGLCGIACPVNIDTGVLIKELRWQRNGRFANFVASGISKNISGVTSLIRGVASVPHSISKIIGYDAMESVTRGLYRLGDKTFPLWTRYTPRGSKKINRNILPASSSDAPMVVYFPACIARSMSDDINDRMLSVLKKGGYTVIIPEEKDKLCCGMAFSSKGFRKQAKQKENEMNDALLKASRNGELPIVCDMSPCMLHMKETLDPRLKLYDQVEFIHDFLLTRLSFIKQAEPVTIHTTCSSTKMQIGDKFQKVASHCSEKVIVPDNVDCCGWAGDRGFFYPELNDSALSRLKHEVLDAKEGYSNSVTCEIGLSLNSDITYKSLVYLVDKTTS